ncbi:hypothetical protein [Paramaledivibacter caminithermalis]|uniref:hypothetical protein n=1 Tax=Paramaledivibacter caminithermalis TaxID=191027 RepID=UPI0013F4BE26|nr:hypothetical protein [Paramaledivibacter caminithermalis]
MTMDYPHNEDDYLKFKDDGIKVFVKKGIKAKNNVLTISVSGFLFFKNLEVYGIDINVF